jgi:MFS family permease
MLVERIGVKNGMMVAGLILLAGGGVGMGFVGLAYLVGRSYAWPDKWLTPHGGKVQRLSLALVLSSLLFASWASGSISSSLPFFVTEKLGLQSSQVTLVYIASSPVLLLAVPVAFIVGPLADFLDWLTLRFVRRRLGRWAFAALGVLGLCGGLGILLSARDVRMLAAAVSVTGLGTAILSPPLLALVATSMPPRLWGTAIGLYLAVDVLALPLGVSVSGMAASRFGPQSPFVIALVVAVLAVLIILMGCWASRNSGKPTT